MAAYDDWGAAPPGAPGRSPSPGPGGRGGRFDDDPRGPPPRRSPPPFRDRMGYDDRYDRGPPGPPYRGRSPPPGYGRKRPRDDSPPGRFGGGPPFDPRDRDPYFREPLPRDYDRRDFRDAPPHFADRGYERDRYGPPGRGPLPDDYYRDRGPPGYRDDRDYYDRRDREPPGPPRPQMQPPSEFPYLVTFRYFTEFMRHTSPSIADDKDRLADQWRRYRADFAKKQIHLFFEDHKAKAWFEEKYSPKDEFVQLRKRLRAKGREGRVDGFLAQLEKGELDDLTFDYAPLKKQTTEAGQNGTVKTEPEAVAEAEAPAKVETDEVKSEEKPVTEQPKPIPTLEPEADEFDFGYDDVEMSRTGSNEGAQAAAASAAAGTGAEGTKVTKITDDVVIIPAPEYQLFIKSIAPEISRNEMEEKFKEVAGFDYLALSDPHTNKKYHRVGWVNFVPGTDMAAAEKALAEIKVGPSQNFSLHIARPKESAYSKLRLAPGISNTPERVVKDLDQARKLVALLEAELADTRGTQAIEAKAAEYAATAKAKTGVTGTGGDTKMEDGPEAGAAAKDEGPSTAEIFGKEEAQTDVETDKRVLDLYLYYLRFVFHSCYYCLGVCDFPEELQRRCAKHVRRPLGSVDKSRKNGKPGNEAGWCKNIDERVAMLIEKDKLDPRDHGGENVDEETQRLCAPLITDEGLGKFRCKSCSKLFKAQNFIEKHIIAKHGDSLNLERLEKIRYLNNYALDPSRTAPPPPQAPEVPIQAAPFAAQGFPMHMFPSGFPAPFAMPGGMGYPPFFMPGMHPGFTGFPAGAMGGFSGQAPAGQRRRHQDLDGGLAKRPRRDGPEAPRGPQAAMAADPRSRNVLAYADLDQPEGEDLQLNY